MHSLVVIADIGVNFNGDLNLAHELIRQASIAGATYAKFQLYDPEALFGRGCKYENLTILDQIANTKLSRDDVSRLKRWCDEEDIKFCASAFDEDRLSWLEAIGVDMHKIASISVEDKVYCDRVLSLRKPTLISLGKIHDPGHTQKPYDKYKNGKYLFCISQYPTELDALTKWFPNDFCAYGFIGISDHSLGIGSSLVAIGRKACVVEKHLTLSRALPGPDHIASITPDELAELCRIGRQMFRVSVRTG